MQASIFPLLLDRKIMYSKQKNRITIKDILIFEDLVRQKFSRGLVFSFLPIRFQQYEFVFFYSTSGEA